MTIEEEILKKLTTLETKVDLILGGRTSEEESEKKKPRPGGLSEKEIEERLARRYKVAFKKNKGRQ